MSFATSILNLAPLSPGVAPWKTRDPFLFCVYHHDIYPKGNENFGPVASLDGRNMGQDFAGIDGWRMYHGMTVPGFPKHPHRGFETITVARQGLLDHSDSMGAKARYGEGDVQWLTAGKGIQHSEMFPLLDRDENNPMELFQIWLNLPQAHKFAEPHFSMLWAPTIPHKTILDSHGHGTHVTVHAGRYLDAKAPSPPPNSWAAQPGSDVGIWTIKLDANAQWTLPATQPEGQRTLYFFEGERLHIGKEEVAGGQQIDMNPAQECLITNGAVESELLMLQGRPIGEPVVQYGPFVMNTAQEIYGAIADYQRTGFGGWPWKESGPIHGAKRERFALRPGGKKETAT
ncbi:MAG: pirin family protein [Myxococcota bacterium]|nr:pirin family protein [Myxococcota bacterium]